MMLFGESQHQGSHSVYKSVLRKNLDYITHFVDFRHQRFCVEGQTHLFAPVCLQFESENSSG